MDDDEGAWLSAVGERLGDSSLIDAETKRVLLRVTKVTADATGIRYLAPLTAYLIGRAAARAEADGIAFDLRGAAEGLSELAAEWARPGS